MSYINIIPVYYAKGITRKVSWKTVTHELSSTSWYHLCLLYLAIIYEILLFLNVAGINAPVASVLQTVPRCRLSEEHFMKCFVKNNTFHNLNQNSNTVLAFHSETLVKHDCLPVLQLPLFLNLQICYHTTDS